MNSDGAAKCPIFSVIIPVHNDAEQLVECLGRLHASAFQDFEVIVVADGSSDGTVQCACSDKERVVPLQTRSGPAAARNAGAGAARGEYLVFLDADVRVHANTLTVFSHAFEAEPAVDAVFGSYDTHPTAPNFVSHYKNLFHHYIHQVSPEEASTYWSGCGAVRKSVFDAVGGFDTRFTRPTVEDIELGIRLRRAGHRIVLKRQAQATHGKPFSTWSMIKSDVRDRAVPWTQLILRERSLPNDLNLTWPQRVSAMMAFGLLVVFALEVLRSPFLFVVPLVLLGLVLIIDYWSSQQRIPTLARCVAVLVILGVTLAVGFCAPGMTAVSLLLAAGIVGLNARFYTFLVRERSLLFAMVVLPLHVLYYIYSGFTFVLVAGWYVVRNFTGRSAAR